MCKEYKETTLKELSKYPVYIVTAKFRLTHCRWLVAL